ncbi:MAG: ABC transporter substrate-binding protein [Actinomycetes bacterium]
MPAVPSSWADLKAARYKGKVAMGGDPRTSGAGFGAVVAAALAAGRWRIVRRCDAGDPVLRRPEAGRKPDSRRGPRTATDCESTGLLAVVVHLAAHPKRRTDCETLRITIPADAVYGSYYAQAITANAPHPCAAALWIEHLNGDSGALGFLQGRALPARFAALEAFGLVSPDVRSVLPRPSQIYSISFPTADQFLTMKRQIDQNWGPMVAGK